MWYQNIGSMFFHFVTKQVCDGQTDRITIPKTTLASIAVLHGNKRKNYETTKNLIKKQTLLN